MTAVNGAAYGGQRIQAGDTVTYTIAYSAPEGTEEIVITDTLPAGTSVAGASPTGVAADGTYVWTFTDTDETFALRGTVTITLQVDWIPAGAATLRNVVRISFDGASGDGDTDDEDLPYGAGKLLTGLNGGDAAAGTAVAKGDTVTYTITYNAPEGATEVVITDEIPAGTTVKNISNGGTELDGVVTWTLAIADESERSGTVTLTLEITDIPADTDTLYNTATVAYNGGEGTLDTEQPETENPYIEGPFKLEETELSYVAPGAFVTYTIHYTNYKDVSATITINDKLDDNLIWVSGGDYNTSTGVTTWILTDVEPGFRGTVVLVARVADGAIAGTAIRNQATVDVDGTSRETNATEFLVHASKIVDSTSASGVGGAAVRANNLITYAISFYNDAEDALVISLTDELDSGVAFVNAINKADGATVGSYNTAEHSFSWTGATVQPSETVTLLLTVRVMSSTVGDTIRNMAIFHVAGEEMETNETVNSFTTTNTSTSSSGSSRYTVTFYWNHSTASSSIYERYTVSANSTVTRPSDPVLEGYSFDGWFLDAEYEQEYDFSSTVTRSLSLYAKWVPDDDIVFDTNHFAYLIGYPVTGEDGSALVKPENPITRGEVATVLLRIISDELRETYWTRSNSYSDVDAGIWYNNAVSTMSNYGLFAGYPDNSFRGDGNITRQEFAAVVARFLPEITWDGINRFDDVSERDWGMEAINIAAQAGWLQGDGNGKFHPQDNISRAEVAAIINRMRGTSPQGAEDLLDNMLTWADNPAPENGGSWYYYDIQEASNSHFYEIYADDTGREYWTARRDNRNWVILQREDATATMLYEGEESWNERAPGYIPLEDA